MVTLVNRAKVATATTGTGTITLGAAESGYQSFSDAGLTGSDTVRYTIEDGDAWEIGAGGINVAVTTMSRTLIESSTGSKLSLSGDAVVYITAAGEDIVQPSDLADVATSGAYSDLSGLPTLGTAAAADTGDFATAAQGDLADSAVQPNDSPSFGSVTVSGTVDGRDVAADGSKLDGIEAGANVTDTANVTAAGALMDSEVTNLAQVKAFDSADYATAAQGALADSAIQAADLATVATTGAYSDLTGTPTPYTNTDVDAHLNTGTATTDQMLSWDGSDYDWVTAGAGLMSATNPVVTSGTITEDVFTLSGTSVALEPDNGSIQTHTLSGNTTYSDGFSAGQAITLMIDDGASRTVTWPTITWTNNGGIAPTLATSGYTVVAVWKVGSTLYGALVGDGS